MKKQIKQKDWGAAFQPLLKEYGTRPHPLEYANIYQLLVMVILSAQTTDKLVNSIAPPFFAAFPKLESLSDATPEDLLPFVSKVRGHRKKIEWILGIAKSIKDEKRIPLTMEGLTALPGIGRKSANVILREAGVKAEGIVVDLHVVRVAPRLGITDSEDPKKIEVDLMKAVPRDYWDDLGMAISYLGREVCRPGHPEHTLCVMAEHCEYYQHQKGKPAKKTTAAGRKVQAGKKTGK